MDTYRVIYTDPDGSVVSEGKPTDRETALAIFGDLANPALPKGARVRVMSDQEWQKVKTR